jgi:hypothetical protein
MTLLAVLLIAGLVLLAAVFWFEHSMHSPPTGSAPRKPRKPR